MMFWKQFKKLSYILNNLSKCVCVGWRGVGGTKLDYKSWKTIKQIHVFHVRFASTIWVYFSHGDLFFASFKYSSNDSERMKKFVKLNIRNIARGFFFTNYPRVENFVYDFWEEKYSRISKRDKKSFENCAALSRKIAFPSYLRLHLFAHLFH